MYVIGGVSDGTRIPDVNRYDATTNAWTPRAPIPVASEAPCGAHWNGKIYVAEGDTGSSFQIYDIAANSWTAGAPRPVASGYGCAAGALNNKVYVIGGVAAPQTQLTIYDIATNTWSTGNPAPDRRLPLRLPDGRQLPVHRRRLRGLSGLQLDRHPAPGHDDRHLVERSRLHPAAGGLRARLLRDEAVRDRRRL